jgi:acetylornithine deacetylase/succinyl-diaminopimelate desuccinylase-like protein
MVRPMANPLSPDVLVDPVMLTRALVDVQSVSRNESAIADFVAEVLRTAPYLSVDRLGNTVMARTDLGREQRVVLAGHLDTVPLNDNFPSTVVDDLICQGNLRAEVHTTGRRAHTARAWRGTNAIHAAAEVLRRLESYRPRTVTIDGCTYREGLSAVGIRGGVAGNVVPDGCTVEVNLRFAPDRSEKQALEHVHEVFEGYGVDLVDSAPGALPGLDAAPAREFLAAVGEAPAGKLGWTDVARFAGLGVPALNYGPGDPLLAHAPDEHVEIGKIRDGAATLHRWLTSYAS